MKTKLHILFLAAFNLINLLNYSQNSLYYKKSDNGLKIQFVENDVSSDFGIRRTASRWHRGIDYNPEQSNLDEGYLLLSPFDGVVTKLDMVGDYIYLIIKGQNYNCGFGHIFMDGSLPLIKGNFVIKQMNNRAQLAIINLSTGIAIGTEIGTVTYNQNIYNVTPAVSLDQAIAPLGTSDVSPPDNAHLHLYYSDDPYTDPQNILNAKNPLEIFNYTAPNYYLSIKENEYQNITKFPNSNPIYYSGSNKASVCIKCRMTDAGSGGNGWWFPNAVMDVETLQLQIKKANSNNSYSPFEGRHYLSTITLGGKKTNYRYPSENHPESNTFEITNDYGNYDRTGVEPFAYSGEDYDNYYFADLYTRIRKNHVFGENINLFARCIDEARYPDGIYDLSAKLTTIKNAVITSSDPYQIIIDNFIPYVQKVELFQGAQKYSSCWNWNKDSEQLIYTENSNYTGKINKNETSDLKIKIYFSEPISSATITLVPPLAVPLTIQLVSSCIIKRN